MKYTKETIIMYFDKYGDIESYREIGSIRPNNNTRYEIWLDFKSSDKFIGLTILKNNKLVHGGSFTCRDKAITYAETLINGYEKRNKQANDMVIYD